MQMAAESGTSSAKSFTQRKRAATKREVNAIMEQPCRTALSAVTLGTRQGVEVLTEPTQVAHECCDYGTRRFGSMEPKWFRPHDAAEGHELYVVDDDSVTKGTTLTGTISTVLGGQRWRMEAARRMHTARHMVDTSRWWLMRWPRNATSLLVRAGGLKDDEACKLLRALRVTAVRFGLELASQPKARRDAKEATDARAALRKRWVAMVGKLGPGYRTKRGAEMPDWVAVAHLPWYKVRRTLNRWSVEVPRAIMPNWQAVPKGPAFSCLNYYSE